MAVDAIKSGALDFIEKPFRGANVVSRIEEALAAARRRPRKAEHRTAAILFSGPRAADRARTRRAHPAHAGATNKEAGRRLGISFRTIEIHRKRIMEKLGAKSATDLIRIVLSENRCP